ncbi:MAG: ACT domain-containing protein [Lachnospiraceae bacterium]|nr:ACT domain-containing protein [Parasporobacterium sp.]MDO4529064.1 ACT domain-containing protein [Lachnospiraceae bacterium]MDO4733851.1 ACT domain-containing protein [Lachnospiraceae bacterium]
MKKTVITVLGKDKVGIIAGVCTYLAEHNVNILDLAQTIVDGMFNMTMIVDIATSEDSFLDLSEGLAKMGEEKLGVQIKMQQEDIFEAMHRI